MFQCPSSYFFVKTLGDIGVKLHSFLLADDASHFLRLLKAALDYLREGDVLVVWKLDRLARSLKQLIETVEDLEKRSVGFRSLTENIDTTTLGGRLVFHIFGALAKFERSIIRERTRAGLEAARARGQKGGRLPALTERDIQMARTLVAPSTLTLYRYLPGGRSVLTLS